MTMMIEVDGVFVLAVKFFKQFKSVRHPHHDDHDDDDDGDTMRHEKSPLILHLLNRVVVCDESKHKDIVLHVDAVRRTTTI